eukprot:jgi/Tetstr1/422108/TSEL_012965.t1
MQRVMDLHESQVPAPLLPGAKAATHKTLLGILQDNAPPQLRLPMSVEELLPEAASDRLQAVQASMMPAARSHPSRVPRLPGIPWLALHACSQAPTTPLQLQHLSLDGHPAMPVPAPTIMVDNLPTGAAQARPQAKRLEDITPSCCDDEIKLLLRANPGILKGFEALPFSLSHVARIQALLSSCETA